VRRDTDHRPAPDLVNRRFVADRPDQFWVADMTYVPTWAGFICLSVVLDAWSRRVVARSIGERMTAELVLAALNMGLEQRRPGTVIHHSDQGCQYTSIAFGNRCTEMGVRPSMGSVGDAYDNATAESFFASLECELLDRRTLKSKTEARLAITWLEGWYNPRRRHSRLGYLSPANLKGNTAKRCRSATNSAFPLRHSPPASEGPAAAPWTSPHHWATRRDPARTRENAPSVMPGETSPLNASAYFERPGPSRTAIDERDFDLGPRCFRQCDQFGIRRAERRDDAKPPEDQSAHYRLQTQSGSDGEARGSPS
jgi:hypothetical protein